jgi:hypothetical protein
MASLRRLRRRLASEGGSLLVEVLVSASIMLTVGAGVVLVLMTSDAQSSLQRSKALATDVAQTKLDALRAIGYNDLRPLTETTTVTEGGVDFTVVSTATPVAQSDAPTGCLTSRARDYLSLKATVTWAKMGARKPVVLQTMVAAPIGAGGGLVVSVTGALGQAVPNIPVALSSGGGSATTDPSGCARWDAVSAGSGYSLSASVPGYVQPNGEQDVSITGLNIAAEETAQKSFAYDRGGQVRIRFRQRITAGVVTVDATSLPQSVTVGTSDPIVRTVDPVVAEPGVGVPQGRFYPYPSTAYSIYADTCASAKPPTTGLASTLIPGGGVAPSATGYVDLQLPSLNVKLTGFTSPATPEVAVKTACGTIIGNRTILADGTLKNPGLPYGTGFTVCAVDGSKRAVATNVANTNYANYANAPGTTPTTLALSTTGATCPFTMP